MNFLAGNYNLIFFIGKPNKPLKKLKQELAFKKRNLQRLRFIQETLTKKWSEKKSVFYRMSKMSEKHRHITDLTDYLLITN